MLASGSMVKTMLNLFDVPASTPEAEESIRMPYLFCSDVPP
jgi:hypothetical protein